MRTNADRDLVHSVKSRLAFSSIVPEVHKAMLEADAAIERTARNGIDPSILELVKIRASQLNGCAFCIDMHTQDARAAGESEQRIYALAAWRDTPFFSEQERAALALTEAMTQLTSGSVSEAVFDQATLQFGISELAVLIATVSMMNAWNRIAITTRMVAGRYRPSMKALQDAGRS
jgi:AhpD family alkylhydroperoxidase